VDATLGIVEVLGTGAVSLSAAARRVGVSPQASYNHFPDKGALLAAAAERSVRGLERAMSAAAGGPGGPAERLEATGVAYVRYACAHPAHFRLWSAPEIADKAERPDLRAAYEDAFAVLLRALQTSQAAGLVREGEPRELALAAWATVHGLAWLLVDGQIAVSGATAHTTSLARETLRVLFQGLRARARA
jgi:AcrR family transcriptional regulator